MIFITINERLWWFAYRWVTALALLFFIFSFLMRALGVESNEVSALASGIYFIGTLFAFLLMVRSGGVLAPIAWYVLGSGLFFGLGSFLWGALPGLIPRADLRVGPGDLLAVNLLNSGSMVVVLIASKLSLGRRLTVPSVSGRPPTNPYLLYRVLLFATLVSLLIDYYFFPVAENLIVRSFQGKFKYITWLCLLGTGVLWHQLSGFSRLFAITIVGLVLVKAILTLSKTEVLYPIICLAAGYWVTNRTSIKVILPMIAFLLFFSLFLVPFVKEGRSASSYDAAKNSLADRVAIVDRNLASSEFANSLLNPLVRIVHGPYQRYLIKEYLMGRKGSSLNEFWIALVPRVLWSEKPDVTRFGRELYNQYNHITNARSALAPTYSAEAYWNYGVLGVLVISALIGLQIGWLSKFWFLSIQGRVSSYIIVAMPAAFAGLSVERWIVATHLGGFVTLLVIWAIGAVILQGIGGRDSSRLRHTGVSRVI
jgi:hypothetical protein